MHDLHIRYSPRRAALSRCSSSSRLLEIIVQRTIEKYIAELTSLYSVHHCIEVVMHLSLVRRSLPAACNLEVYVKWKCFYWHASNWQGMKSSWLFFCGANLSDIDAASWSWDLVSPMFHQRLGRNPQRMRGDWFPQSICFSVSKSLWRSLPAEAQLLWFWICQMNSPRRCLGRSLSVRYDT